MSWDNETINYKNTYGEDRVDKPKPITADEICRQEQLEAERKKSRTSLSIILAKQESARLKERELKREQEKECERMYEEDYDVFISDFIGSTRLTCEYMGPQERDPRFDYDSLMK
jgi:hypothetical protein